MRLGDLDALKKRVCGLCNQYYPEEPCEPSDCVFCNAIKEAPDVDAEPVVHCADCIHLMFSDFYGECKRGYLGGVVRPDDYCSRGERKEDNT